MTQLPDYKLLNYKFLCVLCGERFSPVNRQSDLALVLSHPLNGDFHVAFALKAGEFLAPFHQQQVVIAEHFLPRIQVP